MVPQQSESGRSNSPASGANNSPVQFGSQLVDKHSATPYTDATQVRIKKKKKIPNSLCPKRSKKFGSEVQIVFVRSEKKVPKIEKIWKTVDNSKFG